MTNHGGVLLHTPVFLEGNSVNIFIHQEECTVHYPSFDLFVQILTKQGTGACIGKMDIKSAFRMLPINPADFELLGIKIAGNKLLHRQVSPHELFGIMQCF